MEENNFSINAMRSMEVINIENGERLGFIRDIKIDCDAQRVLSLIMPGEQRGWFSKVDEVEIPWENIYKVGLDVILIKMEGKEIIEYK